MKKYRLPKEFAEKWLTALRSGDYEQGSECLLSYGDRETEFGPDFPEVDKENKSYCCLGVACALTGVSEVHFSGISYVSDDNDYEKEKILEAGYPKELAGEVGFPITLAMLNDGCLMTKQNLEFHFSNVEFRNKPTLGQHYKLSFPEIADFIEDNVELY